GRVRKYGRWALAGLCFGSAFLLKPPLGGGAVVAAVFVIGREWDEARNGRQTRVGAVVLPFVVIGAAALLPILGVALWFWMSGAWGELAWTLFEFTPGYTKLGWTDNGVGAFYRAVEKALTSYSGLLGLG